MSTPCLSSSAAASSPSDTASSPCEVSPVVIAQAFRKELEARALRLRHRDSKVCDALRVQLELVDDAELGGALSEALTEGAGERERGASETHCGGHAYGHFHRMLRIAGLNAPRGVATTVWLLMASGYADVQEVFEGFFNGDNDHFRPRAGWPGRPARVAA